MTKKTDRRTLYTRSVVKDAFIALIDEKPYDKINVTAICKEADISRATFYLHFDNVDDVLDQVIDDALLFSETASGTMMDMVDLFSENPNEEELKRREILLPACQRIADSDRYHSLFMDPLISEHIIQRIAAHEKKTVIPALMENSHISEEEAEILFRFLIHGSFAVNRALNWQKDSRWYRYQNLLGRFIKSGMKEL